MLRLAEQTLLQSNSFSIYQRLPPKPSTDEGKILRVDSSWSEDIFKLMKKKIAFQQLLESKSLFP